MTTNTKYLSDNGWTEEYKMLHDRIALENHSYVATRAERIHSTHWILKLNQEGAQQPITSTTWLCWSEKRVQEIARQILDKDSARLLNYSSQSTNKTAKRISVCGNWRKWLRSRPSHAQAGGFMTSRGETCRQLRPRQQIGIETIGRRAVGIPSILHGLTVRWIFTELGAVSIAWRKTSRQSTEGWTEHPLKQHVQMRTVCHSTYWREWSHFITRTRETQDCAFLCFKIVVIHVSCLVLCRTWHWPQAQVLSHLPHLSFRRSLPHTQVLWRTIHIYPTRIHDRVTDQHKSHLSQVMSPKWSSPETLSVEELSLTGIVGQIRT